MRNYIVAINRKPRYEKNYSLIIARVPIGAHFLIIGLVLALFALFTTSSLWADDSPVAAATAAQTTRATAEPVGRMRICRLPASTTGYRSPSPWSPSIMETSLL